MEITTDKYCNVLIENSQEYQDEYSNKIIPGKFKFSDTVSIVNIIHSDTREGHLSYQQVSNERNFKVPINFDGVFNVKFIVIPTKQWYDRVLKSVSKQDLLDAFGGRLYVYDKDKILEITQNIDEVVSLSDFANLDNYIGLSVNTYSKKLLSICRLHKCYISLCQQIFNNKNFAPCWSKNKVDSELVYKRDLVWMTINVITYLWKQGNNDLEIDRILKQVNSCNGLCNPYPKSGQNSNGCGCSGK